MKYFLPLALLAACAAAPSPVPEVQDDTCGANPRADVIGQDATALEQVMILGMVRVIRPGDIVTRDFRAERINFHIDENEKIVSISCG